MGGLKLGLGGGMHRGNDRQVAGGLAVPTSGGADARLPDRSSEAALLLLR